MTDLSTILNNLACESYQKGKWAGYYEAQDVEIPNEYLLGSIDIPNISTNELVEELSNRKGVEYAELGKTTLIRGPAKILMVRE